MIVTDFQPFSVVEDAGFRNLVSALDPSFVMPRAQDLAGDLLTAKYNQAVKTVRDMLTQMQAVTLTTDNWTSASTENYIAVRAHFITDDFVSSSCLLECVKFRDRHMAENFWDELFRVFSEWGLTSKVVAIVTDNAANVCSAVNLTGIPNLPCFAHTLNLVVQQGLETVSPRKSKVKDIVEYFHRSTVAAEKLRALQVPMKPQQNVLKLKNGVVTR